MEHGLNKETNVVVIVEKKTSLGPIQYKVENRKVVRMYLNQSVEIPYLADLCLNNNFSNAWATNPDYQIAYHMQAQGFGEIVFNDSKIHIDLVIDTKDV